jgi:phosphate-selective porin OprO/OprP
MIGEGLRRLRRSLIWSFAGLVAAASSAYGQAPQEDLKARLDQQAREIQELKALLQQSGLHQTAAEPNSVDEKSVKKIIDSYMADKAAAQKAADEDAKLKLETEGFKVGSDLRLTTRWDYWNGFIAETPNKDFTFHIGGRFQEDTVWFTQSPALKPAPTAGMGDLQDGTFFRRIRINMNGTFWQVFEYNTEFALEQAKDGIVTLDEIFVGMKEIPILGTVRVGHMRVTQGLEGDLMSSSKAMTFLEKSYETDAFFQNFAPGIMFTNSVLDQHMTYAAMAYRQEFGAIGQNDGADFGDGKYAFAGRMTFLPIYQNDGVQLLHLGASGTWRKSENQDRAGGNTDSNFSFVDLRARQLVRDAQGDFGTTFDNGGNLLPGNNNRMVDTGRLFSRENSVAAAELFYVCGPFSLQSEWAMEYVNDCSPLAANGGPTKGIPPHTRSFNGGYIQVSYFLTGEHRTYDRRLGRLDSNYFTGPATNFWLTRDENGGLNVGRGAWEVACRFDYLNLNDGPIQGGVIDGCEVGLNWYLNTNVKIQFEYHDNNRFHLNQQGTPVGKADGTVQGFATRVQLNF